LSLGFVPLIFVVAFFEDVYIPFELRDCSHVLGDGIGFFSGVHKNNGLVAILHGGHDFLLTHVEEALDLVAPAHVGYADLPVMEGHGSE